MIKLNYIFTFIPLITLVLYSSCTIENKQYTEKGALIIDYNTSGNTTLDEFFNFSKSRIIQFEYSDSIILSDRIEIDIVDDFIFVLDGLTKQLYRFDIEGNLINKIGRTGYGHAEYNHPSFFQVDNNDKVIDVLCDAGAKIKTYDYYGNYIKSFNTPLVANSFARVNVNRYYFYSGYYGSDSFNRLHLSDTVNIIRSYLPIKTKAIDATEQNFTSLGNNGLFREMFFPSIYKYDSIGINEIVRFDFGKCEITKRDLQEVDDPFQFLEKINRDGFCSTLITQHGNKILCILVTKQSNKDVAVSHFYVNMKDNTYIKVISNKADNYLHELFYNLRLVHMDKYDNCYFVINPSVFNDVIQAKPNLFTDKFDYNINGNPIMLILSMEH